MTERLNMELSTINENITRIHEESEMKIRKLKKHMKSMKMDGDSDRNAVVAAGNSLPINKEDSESINHPSSLAIMPPLD